MKNANKCGIASGVMGIVVSILIIAFGALMIATIALDLGGLWTNLVINPAIDTGAQPETVGIFGTVADKASECVLAIPTNIQPVLGAPIIIVGIAGLLVSIFCIKRTKNTKNVYGAFGAIELFVTAASVACIIYLGVIGTAILPWLAVAMACVVVGIVMSALKLSAYDKEAKAAKLAKKVQAEREAMRNRLSKPVAQAANGKTLSKPVALRRMNAPINAPQQQEATTKSVRKIKKHK